MVCVNGKTYKLPTSYRSLSISNNKIIIDGKVFDPSKQKKSAPLGPAVAAEFIGSQSPIVKSYKVIGNSNTTIIVGQSSRMEKAGDVLKIQVKHHTTKSQDEIFSKEGLLDVSEFEGPVRIQISIPSSMKMFSLKDFEDASLHFMKLDHLSSEYGTLKLEGCEVRRLECVDSHVITEGSTDCVFNTVDIENSFQDVKMIRTIILDSFAAKTQSGSVRVISMPQPSPSSAVTTMKHFRVQTMSGNVNLTLPGSESQVKTMSGSVVLDRPGDNCSITTMSGSVMIHDPGNRCRVSTMSGSLNGSGRNRVHFNTMSGSNSYNVRLEQLPNETSKRTRYHSDSEDSDDDDDNDDKVVVYNRF